MQINCQFSLFFGVFLLHQNCAVKTSFDFKSKKQIFPNILLETPWLRKKKQQQKTCTPITINYTLQQYGIWQCCVLALWLVLWHEVICQLPKMFLFLKGTNKSKIHILFTKSNLLPKQVGMRQSSERLIVALIHTVFKEMKPFGNNLHLPSPIPFTYVF